MAASFTLIQSAFDEFIEKHNLKNADFEMFKSAYYSGYDEGYEDGYSEGYDEGDGYDERDEE